MRRGFLGFGFALALFCLQSLLASEASGEGAFARPMAIVPEVPPTVDGIELNGTLELAGRSVDGTPVTGLSGLAWDADERLLYAVSDRGRLLHLRPKWREGRLVDVDFIAGFVLKQAQGQALSGRWRDAEGLVARRAANSVHGDTELLVSFEQFPRLVRYTPRGEFVAEVPLQAPFNDVTAYQGRNKGLEAVTEHPHEGIVIAPEKPLRDEASGMLTLGTSTGKRWAYPRTDTPGSAIVAMETLRDGRLLILERAYVAPWWPLVVTLRTAEFGSETRLEAKTLAVLDEAQGWQLDNFEGLTRHEGNRFLMVSDDNRNPAQKTLLVYFRLPELSD